MSQDRHHIPPKYILDAKTTQWLAISQGLKGEVDQHKPECEGCLRYSTHLDLMIEVNVGKSA